MLCESSNDGWTLATNRCSLPVQVSKPAFDLLRKSLDSGLGSEMRYLRPDGRFARSRTVAARKTTQVMIDRHDLVQMSC